MNPSICKVGGMRLREGEGGRVGLLWWGGAHQVQIAVGPWQAEPAASRENPDELRLDAVARVGFAGVYLYRAPRPSVTS